jgi:hypothetical protein
MNQNTKPDLAVLGYSPDDISAMTSGAVSRTRVFEDMRAGRLRAKKAGKRTIIEAEEARRYIAELPDRPTKPAA